MPLIFEKMNYFSLSNLRAECNLRVVPSNLKLPSYSDFNYLQKVNAKCPQIPDEKTKFCLVDKSIKSYLSKRRNSFFSSEIWGHFAFTFCRYLKSEYEGIYFLQVLPAKSICWCHLILMKKYPLIMIDSALWKRWHLLI